MPESHRDRFLRRLSTVGAGLRHDIQLGLGTIVADLRDLVIDGTLPDAEVKIAVDLHDRVETLWQASLRSNPPVAPEEIAARVRDLMEKCEGPVAGFRVRLEAVLQKARALQQSKRER